MWMIERRIGAHAHEFLRADLDDGNPGIVVEVRNDIIGHRGHLAWQWQRTQSNWRGNLKCRAPYWRVELIASTASFLVPPHAHLLMQIRHNLVLGEKPFFRRGCCVAKAAHYLSAIVGDIWLFGMNGFSG
jgi:hypothetical protein